MKPSSTAVVFAGGKSSRMGEDKALLPFGTSPSLSHFQFEKLKTLFTQVFFSAKTDKFDFDVPVILDIAPESSPLVGLLSIFKTLEVESVFILAVDAPFVSEEVILKLMDERYVGYDAVIAKSPSGLQPLCGVYRRSIVPVLEHQYHKSQHKLTTLLLLANTCIIAFDDDTLFTNLNHPNEYQEALKRQED